MSKAFPQRFESSMPLGEFIEKIYIPAAGRRTARNPTRQLKAGRLQQLAYFVRLLTAYHHRPPTVADLTPENLTAFVAWHRAAFPTKTGQWLGIDCRALLGFVRLVPDMRKQNGRAHRELSKEPGSLWHVCEVQYFPRALRIRADKTRLAYRQSMGDFKESLGHEPTLADLTDDNVIAMMVYMANAKNPDGSARFAIKTINERAGRLKALWTWCAKRRLVDQFPAVERIPEPRRIPRAWTEDELVRLFHACRQEQGEIEAGILAADWWVGLHWFLWSTGERIGAVFACRWDWLDWNTGYIQIDAEFRKGKDADFLHKLRPECLEVLARMKPAGHELIFPWPKTGVAFYAQYGVILKWAGLSHDRKSKTHKMRRSVASHLQAKGIDACAALGHSSPDVTRRSYLDPRIVAPKSVADSLFNPEDKAHPAIARLPGPPALLEYHPAEPPAEFDRSIEWIA